MAESKTWFGIRCRSLRTGEHWIVKRGHRVGPFASIEEAEKSARKKNKLAAERAPDLFFEAASIDLDPWGLPTERRSNPLPEPRP